MRWSILNVSIPVYDLNESKIFYEMILGETIESEELYQPLFNSTDSCFLGTRGFGIRLYKLKPDLILCDKIQSRFSYVTLLVNNINEVIKNLKKENYKFIFNEFNSFKSIIVQEPSFNLIQMVEHKDGFDENIDGWNMSLPWGIHHINLQSYNVRESIDFFCNIIGLSEGKWNAPINKGDFSIDPNQLAILPLSNNNRGIHIIKADDGFGWRNKFAHNPSIGGHPAFTIKNISKLKKKLKMKNILYSDAKIYAMPRFHQIYLYDENSNMIEINQFV